MALDVSSDCQVLVPVCEPVLTSGITTIKLKLQQPVVAQVWCIYGLCSCLPRGYATMVSVKAACRRSTAGHKTFYRCLFSLSACSLVWVFDLRPPFLGPATYKTSGSQLWKEFIETLDSRLI